MSPNQDPTKITPRQVVFDSRYVVVGGQVGCLTLIIVLASVFGGLFLDNLFGTKPLITILLVLASAPVSLVLTFWVARRAIQEQSNLSKASEEMQSSTTEGETTGE